MSRPHEDGNYSIDEQHPPLSTARYEEMRKALTVAQKYLTEMACDCPEQCERPESDRDMCCRAHDALAVTRAALQESHTP